MSCLAGIANDVWMRTGIHIYAQLVVIEIITTHLTLGLITYIDDLYTLWVA